MMRPKITFVALLLSVTLAACGESGPTEGDLPSDLLVTWHSTELLIDGVDRMEAGTRLALTFSADGTYAVVAARDLGDEFCGEGPDCDEVGTFVTTGSEIVFDVGDPDPTTLSFSVNDSTLRIFGVSDGRTADWTFVRHAVPELIGTWMATSLLDDLGPIMEGGVETTLVITFEADGSYRYASTFSPPDVFCDPELSCVDEGLYTVDAGLGTITFDPSTADETTLDLQVAAPTATLSGSLDGSLQDWSFTKLDVVTPGEVGRWRAISMDFAGVDIVPSGTTQMLDLDGFQYEVTTVMPPVRFMCGVGNVPPDCSALGSYAASDSEIDFLDGLAAGALTLSADITPATMRLTGTIDATAADFLYARVPN